MPVQINEMVITVEVDTAPEGQNATPTGLLQESMTKQIIAESIDQIMDIMRNKNER